MLSFLGICKCQGAIRKISKMYQTSGGYFIFPAYVTMIDGYVMRYFIFCCQFFKHFNRYFKIGFDKIGIFNPVSHRP